MRSLIRVRGRLVCAVLLVAVAGCGRRDGPSRTLAPVTGGVLLDGNPLPAGEVYFVPQDTEAGAQGYFVDICVVKDGTFSGTTSPGTRVVQIWSFKQSDAPPDPITGDKPLPVNTIPARFNEGSQLRVEVKESGKNAFQFEVRSR